MDLDEYQRSALRTARAADAPDEIFHLVLGLCGEAGEVAEKVKKVVRDEGSDFARMDRSALAGELGDVLWYLAVLANWWGLTLEAVAEANIAKLADRSARGALRGSGDDR